MNGIGLTFLILGILVIFANWIFEGGDWGGLDEESEED